MVMIMTMVAMVMTVVVVMMAVMVVMVVVGGGDRGGGDDDDDDDHSECRMVHARACHSPGNAQRSSRRHFPTALITSP